MKTLSTRIVYKNRWMTVREDDIQRPDGSQGIYGVVEKPDFAVVAAIDGGRVFLVEQFRYPIGARRWELPQGTWGAGASGSALDLARAELREETGITAASMQHVARLHEAYGYSTQAFDVYLATGLTQGEQHLEPEEQDLICQAFTIERAVEMVCNGEITDAVTVAAFGLLKLKGHL